MPAPGRTKHALGLLVVAGLVVGSGACGGDAVSEVTRREAPNRAAAEEDRAEENGAVEPAEGRITARPVETPGAAPRYGLHELGVTNKRDALIYVPPTYQPENPAPLVLGLHGANGTARASIDRMVPRAERAGMIVVGVASRRASWDMIYGGYGPDVAVIDRALKKVFSRYAVDHTRVGIEGFSDGASYALSLGLTNGDLFRHVMAFSPGYVDPAGVRGRPRVFISHGTEDPVLPIDRTSRRIVPRLRKNGYDVRYTEFAGGHVPDPVAVDAAVRWFVTS